MFATPLGLLALLAVPAVLALHLLRRRSRMVRVSTLELWADLAAPPTAGRRFERLQRSASLWLELAAAALLGLALGGPGGCGREGARHLVVVLDARAALLAVGADGRSARERALDELDALLDDLGAGDTVTWVESGPRPRILGEAAAGVADARGALAAWRPGLRAHELAPALALARDLAHARRAGERVETWLVTDRFEPDRWPKGVGVVAVGERAPNAAITGAWRGALDRERGLERVEVTVVADARVGGGLAFAVRDALGRVLATRAIEFDARGRAELALEIPLAADLARTTLELALERTDGTPHADALALDDRAWLAPEHTPTLVLAADADADFRRALGLGGEDGAGLDGWLALAAPARVGTPAEADLVLTRSTAAAPSRAFTLRFVVEGDERAAWVGPFLAERGHPLLDGVEWRRALWLSSAEPGALRGDVIVSAGDHALVSVADSGASAVVEFDLDLERSTWLDGADWPILLANLAAWRRARLPRPARTNVAPGDDFVVPEAPAGTWRLVAGGSVVAEARLERAGELRLTAPRESRTLALEHDGARFADLAVALVDEEASDLTRASRGRRAPVIAPDEVAAGELADDDERAPAARAELAGTLLAVALAALVADWFVLALGARRRSRPEVRA